MRDDYPLTKTSSFWINIPLVYFLLPLSGIVAHFYRIEWGLSAPIFSFLNAFAHVVMCSLFCWKYNPGAGYEHAFEHEDNEKVSIFSALSLAISVSAQTLKGIVILKRKNANQ